MIRATVLTSIMDEYDTLRPVMPQDGAEVNWVCLTDSKTLRDDAQARWEEIGNPYAPMTHPTGWEIIYYDRPADEHPNRAAKRPKMHPGMYTSASVSVWLDASFRVTSPRFVADVTTIAAESPFGIAQFRHPWRDCLFSEVTASLELPKYADEAQRIRFQRDAYMAAGMPPGWGLWATGVIARVHTQAVLDWGRAWGRQIDAYSYQDQISHPYALWRAGLRPVDLPGNHFHNSWLAYEGSGRH